MIRSLEWYVNLSMVCRKDFGLFGGLHKDCQRLSNCLHDDAWRQSLSDEYCTLEPGLEFPSQDAGIQGWTALLRLSDCVFYENLIQEENYQRGD